MKLVYEMATGITWLSVQWRARVNRTKKQETRVKEIEERIECVFSKTSETFSFYYI